MKAFAHLPRFQAAVLLVALGACTCDQKKTAEPDPFADWKRLFDVLLKDLPTSEAGEPLDAIPASLVYHLASPDPNTLRAWAEKQPFAVEMMKTPLFADLRMSSLWLSLDGLRRQASRAASFVGDAEDAEALWTGPTAIGAEALTGESPALVVAKQIEPRARTLVRLAAAFAMIKAGGDSGVTEREVEKIKVRTLRFHGREVSFALFRDLLIAGTREDLVARAAALAQDSPQKVGEEKDRPASALREKGLLPPSATPGVHFMAQLGQVELSSLLALDAVGISLVPDAAAPLVLRRAGEKAPAGEVLGLLRYAPAQTAAALLDAGRPEATILAAAQRGVAAAQDAGDEGGAGGGAGGGRKKKSPSLAGLDVARALGAELLPGVLIALGTAADAADAAGDPSPLIGFRHASSSKKLEPVVRRLLEGLLGQAIERTVLEDRGGAILLARDEEGPAAALSDDALLFALSSDVLRRALDAGAGKAPSLRDRRGVDLAGEAAGGVFLDLERTGRFLKAFYAEAREGDSEVDDASARAVLDPTFDALMRGGALFARLHAGGGGASAEGALRALP